MSNRKVVVSIIFPLIIFFIILLFFGRNDNKEWSLFTSFLSALIALVFVGKYLRKYYKINYNVIILGTYILKVVIGIIHYLIYIQPDYFENGILSFLDDYSQMHYMMSIAADSRIHNGFFSFVYNPSFFMNKDASIYYLLSTFYYVTGNNVLNIAVLNSFLSSLTAIIVLQIYFILYERKEDSKFILFLACLFPMNIISSALMRDIAGQYFIGIGVLLLVTNYKSKIINYLSLIISMFLMSLQRAIYILFPLFTYIINKYKRNKYSLFIVIVLLATLYFSFIIDFSFVGRFKDYTFNSQFNIRQTITFLLLPIRAIRALIGPIPWTNVFSNTMQTTYLSTIYLQSVFDITILYFICKSILRGNYNFGKIEIVICFFFFTGIITPDIHVYYFATAFIFLIPKLYEFKLQFFKQMEIVLFGYIIFNILYIGLEFAGSGIWESLSKYIYS